MNGDELAAILVPLFTFGSLLGWAVWASVKLRREVYLVEHGWKPELVHHELGYVLGWVAPDETHSRSLRDAVKRQKVIDKTQWLNLPEVSEPEKYVAGSWAK